MNFRLTTEQAAFQQEVLSFIENELPEGWDSGGSDTESRRWSPMARQIKKMLAKRRWLAMPWPAEYGGMGASPMQQLVYYEQMSYRGVPGFHEMGVMWVGPVVMLYGSEEQKKEYLPGIAGGEVHWCTLYSEPAAGSDLAAMATRAVRDGDDYVINGQKIWTTGGHVADMGWLAARTDPSAPKHKGISMFAIDMKTPGITIRPLQNLAGTHEFNEVFFEDVRVPARQLIGEENRGWYYVAVGLDFERSSIGATSTTRRTVERVVGLMRDGQVSGTAANRMRMVDHAIAIDVLRYMSYNVAAIQEKTGTAPTREAQMAKLFGAELNQRVLTTTLQLFGMEAQANAPASTIAPYVWGFLRAQANTVEGGTSEIQRNVIATRGLGLPRE